MKRLSAGSAAFAAAGGFVLLYAAVLSCFIRLPSGLLLTALTGVALLLTGVFYTRLKKRKWPLGLLCAAFALLPAFMLFLVLYGRCDTASYDEDVLLDSARASTAKPSRRSSSAVWRRHTPITSETPTRCWSSRAGRAKAKRFPRRWRWNAG